MTSDAQKQANDLINAHLHQSYDRRHEWPAGSESDDDQAVDADQTTTTPQTANQRLNDLIRGLARRRGE